ncbi:hypothetical protein NSER024013_55590 [Nocardia seriolae]|nr:hypothetical protein NSER024013_55590 [Nocardia seriolae]
MNSTTRRRFSVSTDSPGTVCPAVSEIAEASRSTADPASAAACTGLASCSSASSRRNPDTIPAGLSRVTVVAIGISPIVIPVRSRRRPRVTCTESISHSPSNSQ